MAMVTTTLTGGTFRSTNSRVAQLAGWLSSDGFTPCWLVSVGQAAELQQPEGDIRKEAQFEFRVPMQGKPAVLTAIVPMDGSSTISVLLTDAETGEVLAGNDEGNFPPVIHEINPRLRVWFNRWIGSKALCCMDSLRTGKAAAETSRQQRKKKNRSQQKKAAPTRGMEGLVCSGGKSQTQAWREMPTAGISGATQARRQVRKRKTPSNLREEVGEVFADPSMWASIQGL